MAAARLITVLLVCGLAVNGCSTSAVDTRPRATPAVKKSVATAGEYEVFGKTYPILPHSRGYLEIGVASWYGEKFQGRLTANGEIYDMHQLTAAHKSLPLPTYVRVTNLDNGRKTVVRVNDRGPFHDDRLVDLSFKAATDLGLAGRASRQWLLRRWMNLIIRNERNRQNVGRPITCNWVRLLTEPGRRR